MNLEDLLNLSKYNIWELIKLQLLTLFQEGIDIKVGVGGAHHLVWGELGGQMENHNLVFSKNGK